MRKLLHPEFAKRVCPLCRVPSDRAAEYNARPAEAGPLRKLELECADLREHVSGLERALAELMSDSFRVRVRGRW